MESQKSIRPRDRYVRLRPLSLGLRDSPHQDLSYTLLEGEDYWIERNGWQWRQEVQRNQQLSERLVIIACDW